MSEEAIDIQIGKKLRQFRTLSGLSQGVLAEKTGITFQQIQKYEKGVNRISASRLFDFSKILGVSITDFFDLGEVKRKAFGENDNTSEYGKGDMYDSKETLVLIREYYKIKDANKRKLIIDTIRAMNDGEN